MGGWKGGKMLLYLREERLTRGGGKGVHFFSLTIITRKAGERGLSGGKRTLSP